MGPVIATGRPSLAALPGHRVGPWAVDYADHGIGTAGLGIERRDVARDRMKDTCTYFIAAYRLTPFLSP
jgi:hypothetical protein